MYGLTPEEEEAFFGLSDPSSEDDLPLLDIEILRKIYWYYIALLVLAGTRISFSGICLAVIELRIVHARLDAFANGVFAVWLVLIACQTCCVYRGGKISQRRPSTNRGWVIACGLPIVGVLALIGVAGWLRKILRHNNTAPSFSGLDEFDHQLRHSENE